MSGYTIWTECPECAYQIKVKPRQEEARCPRCHVHFYINDVDLNELGNAKLRCFVCTEDLVLSGVSQDDIVECEECGTKYIVKGHSDAVTIEVYDEEIDGSEYIVG